MRIPAAGLFGQALREAAPDLMTVIKLVRAAIEAKLNVGRASGNHTWPDLEAIYADRAVICDDGHYWSYPYTIDDANQVVLGERVEVIESYVPVTAPLREASDTPDGHFVEAAGDGSGLVWDAVLVRSGLSKNGRYYPDALLREAAPLFEGRPVFAKGDAEHIAGDGKDVRNIVGYVGNVKFVEGAAADTGALCATVTFLAAASSLPETIREAWNRGKRDLVGLSIDATGTARTQMMNGRKVKVAASIRKVDSVDLIVDPGAGGGLVRMVEAAEANPQLLENTDMGIKERMLEAIKAKDAAKAAAIDLATISDEALETAYREALEPLALAAVSAVTREDLRMVEARASARIAIAGCKLPAAAVDKLQADFAGRERFTEADVHAAIKAEREYLARFTESGHVRMAGLDIAITEPRSTKIATMLDAFFDEKHKDHRSVQSFRECYREITGDDRVTGRLDACDPARLREAVGERAFREALDSTSFADVLGSSITRRMVADYRDMGQYDVWRNLASVVPVNDFRTNERTRYGGYGDLPAVAEGDPYAALTSPSDEAATYAISKRGGTEVITMEMIRNDDVGAIRRLPVKIARSAKRTLAKFVLDFIRSNPAIYDAVALFHATHGNLGAAALDATSLAAGRLAMLKQTEDGSSDRLGIGPRYLWVPEDLVEAASNLFNRSTNNDKTFVQSMTLTICPVWYWTDTNDWALSADPLDIPTIEIGFLDGNQEPELFVQDTPNVGSLFSHDKLTYKVRHIYGGNVLDYRGLYKAVVA